MGNLGDVDVKSPLDTMVNLTNKYGPIVKLSLPGLEMVVVSDWELVHEACNDSRFRKSIKGEVEVRKKLAYPVQRPGFELLSID